MECSTIDELIAVLTKLREEHGNLPVRWDSISHRFKPEVFVRDKGKSTAHVVLNG